MEVVKDFRSRSALKSSVLTIGSYDGVHRGHHNIINSLVSHSKILKIKSVLVTFDPHPRHILDKKDDKFPILMSLDIKLKVFKQLGVELVYVIPFDKKFSDISARDFLDNIIVPYLNPNYIIIGKDHHFGKNRSGTTEFLRKYCIKKEISLEVIELLSDQNVKISSTNIRNLITNGYIRRANFELGSTYGFLGKVIHGSGRGRSLNFPTANIISIEKKQLMPKPGVYLIRARIIGLFIYGMCNFGQRLTFNESDFVVEIHFFNHKFKDLYDKDIWVEFLERIRNEIKFASSNQLIVQLEKDKKKCLKLKVKYN